MPDTDLRYIYSQRQPEKPCMNG
ncbi:hypothetical protein [Escherichia coli]